MCGRSYTASQYLFRANKEVKDDRGRDGGVTLIDHSTGGYFLTFPESKRVNKGIERCLKQRCMGVRANTLRARNSFPLSDHLKYTLWPSVFVNLQPRATITFYIVMPPLTQQISLLEQFYLICQHHKEDLCKLGQNWQALGEWDWMSQNYQTALPMF